MNSKFLLIPTLLVALASGCAPKHASLKPEDSVLNAGTSWEVNRAVMNAGNKSNNVEMAINAGESELAQNPHNDEARLMLARLQCRAGRIDQAHITLSGLSEKAYGSDQGIVEQARLHIASNEPEQALVKLDSLSKKPEPSTLRESDKLRAIAMDLSGRHQEAQGIYRSLLTYSDEHAVRYNYGRSLVAGRDYAQAAAVFLPLVDNSDYPKARILAAACYAKIGNRNAVRNLLEGYLSSEEIDRLLAGSVD